MRVARITRSAVESAYNHWMGDVRAIDRSCETHQAIEPQASEVANRATDGAALGAAAAGPAGGIAPPPVAFRVPQVIDTARFADPAARNAAINASYHEFDVALTAYLGQPFVANWATFGKHASAHVGNEMAVADDSLRILGTVDDLERLAKDLEHGNGSAAMHEIHAMVRAIEDLAVLFETPHILCQAGGMARAFLCEAVTDMRAALGAAHGLGNIKAALAVLTSRGPKLRGEIQTMKDELADGNRRIYDNIAPCLAEFLACGQAALDGIPASLVIPSDGDGFMVAAFHHYVAARRLTNQLREPAHANDAGVLDDRLSAVKLANLTLVTHEQMVAQPDYDGMKLEMDALRGRMTMEDPTGTSALLPAGGNWGNFYERLGYDESRAPSDFRAIDPDHLPPLLPRTDPRYQGSIAEYFDRNAQETRLVEAPKPPRT